MGTLVEMGVAKPPGGADEKRVLFAEPCEQRVAGYRTSDEMQCNVPLHLAPDGMWDDLLELFIAKRAQRPRLLSKVFVDALRC